jgi:peptide/nickel transport system substrate-binding protein
MGKKQLAGVMSLVSGLLLMSCTGLPSAGPSPAPSSGGSPSPGTPKRLTLAIRGEPFTLSQSINGGASGSVAGVDDLEDFIQAGLVTENGQKQLVPRLAEAVPSLDNGLWKLLPDGRMETTWVIKEGATWHDGTPLTTDDLLFTLEVGRDPDIAALHNAAFKYVESITARDPHTVTVFWSQPYIDADRMWGPEFAMPLPKHILENAYRSDKASFTELPYWTSEFIGTGPYRVDEYVQGGHLILHAYDQFVLGRPKIDQIEVKFINDPNVIIANVLSGTVDVTLGRGLSLEQTQPALEQWGAGRQELLFESWNAYYPQFVNPDPSVIADVQFRRALMHAVDRQQLAQAIQFGQVPVAEGFPSPDDPYYAAVQDSIVHYPYDVRAAMQLIEGLGYAKGADGFYHDASGTKLAVETRSTDGDAVRRKLLLAVADFWKQLGVDTETVIIPRQRAIDREYRNTRPGFELTRQPNDFHDRSLRRFYSSEAAMPANDFSGSNRARYMNPELDGLIDRFFVTMSQAQRVPIAQQIVHHLSENLVTLPMFYAVSPYLITNRLQDNIAANRPGSNAEAWDFK